MLTHMKEQKDRGVRFGRIFSVCFSRGDDKKCIKKIHRWRANSRAVFRAHEMKEQKDKGGEVWEDFFGVF